MRHYLILTLKTLLISSILSSCGGKKEKTFGLLLPSQNVARYIAESNFMKERAEQLGVKVIIEFAENNDANQIRQAKELIDKVDGLCIIPVNGNTAAEIVRDYKSKGLPVIAYNRLIQNSRPDYYVSGDNVKLAELMVNTALKHKPNGNYFLLGGDKFDLNGLQLQQNIDSLLKPHETSGAIHVIFRSFTEDWSSELAAYNLKKAIHLSGIKPDAIIAAYDGMAEAAINVMKEIYGEVGDVVITGQDAELRAIKHIMAGEQTMTAYHSAKDNAYACAEAIVALMNGKKASTKNITYTFNGEIDVPTIKIPSLLVTKENVEEVIIKNKVYTREEIYN